MSFSDSVYLWLFGLFVKSHRSYEGLVGKLSFVGLCKKAGNPDQEIPALCLLLPAWSGRPSSVSKFTPHFCPRQGVTERWRHAITLLCGVSLGRWSFGRNNLRLEKADRKKRDSRAWSWRLKVKALASVDVIDTLSRSHRQRHDSSRKHNQLMQNDRQKPVVFPISHGCFCWHWTTAFTGMRDNSNGS